jgi:hypothetical protein
MRKTIIIETGPEREKRVHKVAEALADELAEADLAKSERADVVAVLEGGLMATLSPETI